MHDENNNESNNGSVWTSYSDLFMALAVVFLILLVFALLKSGITKVKSDLERKQQEQYLVKANVPEKESKRNNKDLDTLKDTISKISLKKQAIKESLNEIDQLASVLERREKVVTRLMKDYKKKLAAVNSARKTIQKQDSTIKELKESESNLAKELESKESKEQRLTKMIEKLEAKKNALEETIAKNQSQLREQRKSVAVQRNTVDSLNQDLSRTHDRLQSKVKRVEIQQDKINQQNNLIKNLQAELRQTRSELTTSNKQNNNLQKEFEKVSNRLHSSQENLQQSRAEANELKETLTASRRTASGAQQELTRTQAELNKAQSQNANLKSQVKDLSQGAGEASKELAGLRKENRSLKGKLAGLGKENQKLSAENESLLGRVNGLQAKASAQANEIGNLKAEFAKLGGKLANLGKANENLKGQVEGLKQGLADARADGKAKAAEIGRLQGQLKGAQRGLASASGKAEKLGSKLERVAGSHDELSARLSSCTQDLQANILEKKKKSRQLSSIKSKLDNTRDAIGKIYDERKNIATDISKALGAKGFDVTVDSTSGVVTLNMDESFYFKKNSAELSETAKEKLRNIVPIYAKSLLGSDYAKRIAGITITGFASPTYHKKYVDPESYAPEAYSYNLHLSMDRAEKIAEYIFGDEIGNYAYKDSLKTQTTVSGAGYMKPIIAPEKDRKPAACGIYDCPKSRRVEFNFILKDKKAIDSKLLGIGAKI